MTVLPEWKTLCPTLETLTLTRLSGAMTNQMFIANCNETRVLLRIYGNGTDAFFDRERETDLMQIMSALNVGPRLLGMFHNGRVEEFLDARTLTPTDLRDPDISVKIAAKLFDLHSLVGIVPPETHQEGRGVTTSDLWHRLRTWIKRAESAVAILKERDGNASRLDCVDLSALSRHIDRFESDSKTLASPVLFAHNDVNLIQNSFVDARRNTETFFSVTTDK
jgi:thiamine kinase-like enzyme